MDVSKEDLNVVFSILDKGEDGKVGYHQFVEEIYKMRSSDSHTLLVFIKFYVTDLRRKADTHFELLVKVIGKLSAQTGQNLDYLLNEVNTMRESSTAREAGSNGASRMTT